MGNRAPSGGNKPCIPQDCVIESKHDVFKGRETGACFGRHKGGKFVNAPNAVSTTRGGLTGKARWLLLLAILVAGACLRFGALSRPIEVLDGRTLPDDTYISLEIAKNIGQGHGPLYGDSHTNGFQPLYVFLSAPIYAGADGDQLDDVSWLDTAVKKALVILILADLLAMVLLAVNLAARFGWTTPTYVATAVWAGSPLFIKNSLNGLETSLSVLMLLAVWTFFARRFDTKTGDGRLRRTSWYDNLLLGGLLGLAVLARIDLLFLAVWVGLLLVWDAATGRREWTALARQLPLIALGFAVVFVPWGLYSWRHTGMVYPVSGSAVRFMALANVGHAPDAAFFWQMTRLAGQAVFGTGRLLWMLVLAVGALALGAAIAVRDRRQLARWREDLRWIRLPLFFALTLMAAYVFYMPAHWFFSRYLIPWAVLALLLVGIGLDRLQSNWPRIRSAVTALVLTTAVLITSVALPEQRDLLTGEHDPNLGYRHFGLWARDNFQPGVTVGSSQTGALAYYATQLDVVNMDGVVNQAALASLRESRHMAWIEGREIRFVLGFPVNIRFIFDHSSHGAKQRLRPRGKIEGFRSWGNDWLVCEVVQGQKRTPGPSD